MVSKEMWALGANRSVIRDLFEYGLQQAKVVGPENVFDYSLGNPSIPSPPQVNEAVAEILRDMDSIQVHGYTLCLGRSGDQKRHCSGFEQPLRGGNPAGKSVHLLWRSTWPHCHYAGAGGGRRKRNLWPLPPFFPEYRPFAKAAGGNLVVVPADTEHFQVNLEALEAALTPNTQAVIVNSPNNPTGTVYTSETIQALGRLLTRKGEEYGHPIYILADEPYRELVYGEVEVPFIPNLYDHTIVCYSYSKSLSLPGERIGYICVPDRAADSKDLYATIAGAARAGGHVCAPSLWQKVIALRAPASGSGSLRSESEALQESLTKMGYRMASPDGAFYLFIQAPNGDDLAFSEMAKQKNLLLVPGVGFDCPGWFRICYCVSYDMIQRSLPVFQELMEACR